MYQSFARNMLKEVLKTTSRRADLVFDVYVLLSIKDIEKKDREEGEIFEAFSIGIKQKIEGNINELLSNSNLKNELLNFLYTEYQDPFYAALIGDKEFFCSANNRCMKFYCADLELKCIKESSLFGEHLEAETRVMFHAKHAN